MKVRNTKYEEQSTSGVFSIDQKKQVEVSFELNEVGEVENISLSSSVDQENLTKAMETIDQFKSWLPDKEFGNRCKIKLSIPVTF